MVLRIRISLPSHLLTIRRSIFAGLTTNGTFDYQPAELVSAFQALWDEMSKDQGEHPDNARQKQTMTKSEAKEL